MFDMASIYLNVNIHHLNRELYHDSIKLNLIYYAVYVIHWNIHSVAVSILSMTTKYSRF